MMLTSQLKKEITDTIHEKNPDIDISHINFKCCGENSTDGTYVFTLSETYCYMVIERGERYRKEACDINELIFYILEEILFKRACNYSAKNRATGQDFRRLLFDKEIEEFSIFGDEFKKRITAKIKETLEKYPYDDLTGFDPEKVQIINRRGIKYYLLNDVFAALCSKYERIKKQGNLTLKSKVGDTEISITIDLGKTPLTRFVNTTNSFLHYKKLFAGYTADNISIDVLHRNGKLYINGKDLNEYLNRVWEHENIGSKHKYNL